MMAYWLNNWFREVKMDYGASGLIIIILSSARA